MDYTLKKSVSCQKKDGRSHARPSLFDYDNDKDLKVCFLVTCIMWGKHVLLKEWKTIIFPCNQILLIMVIRPLPRMMGRGIFSFNCFFSCLRNMWCALTKILRQKFIERLFAMKRPIEYYKQHFKCHISHQCFYLILVGSVKINVSMWTFAQFIVMLGRFANVCMQKFLTGLVYYRFVQPFLF